MTTQNATVKFRNLVVERFAIDELDTLCDDLLGDHELIPGRDDGKEVYAREIITYLDNRGRLLDIVDWCREQRPNLHAALDLIEQQFKARQLEERQAAADASAHVSQPPNNLPASVTPLVGRDVELAELVQLLQQEDVRLVTITGPGGVGKTRLAIEVASKLRQAFADGLFFIDLSPINDPSLVASAIASKIGVHEEGSRAIAEQLGEHLRTRETLPLLDNFEQVLAASLLLAGLMETAPRLKLLVTSRTALDITGEHLYALEPLALPDLKARLSLDQLAKTPAIALFVQRAQAAKRTFNLTEADARAVAEICTQLDGLPLAIELAAARIRLFQPKALLDQLNQHWLSLTGARDLPARQRMLKATIDWSYALLEEPERQLFVQLGVFVGGFTPEAITAIVIDDDPSLDLFTGLDVLVNNSLIKSVDGGSEQTRFAMLETMREYALDVLHQHGSEPTLRARHLAYYLALAESADLTGKGQAEWLVRLETEHGNLRAAVSFAIGQVDPTPALRLGAALWRFWRLRGYRSEGRHWLDAIIECRTVMVEQPADGDAQHPPQRTLATAQALNGAAVMADEQGDFARAVPLYEESLALFRRLDDKPGVARVLMNLGIVELAQGHYAEAQARFDESLTVAREANAQSIIACNLNNLGAIAYQHGDIAHARALYEESQAITSVLGISSISAVNLSNLGQIAYMQSDDVRARALFAESLKLCEDLGNPAGIAHARANVGWVELRQGDVAEATPHFVAALKCFFEVGEPRNMAECLEGLAGVAAVQKLVEHAALLCAAADKLRANHDTPRPPNEDERYQRIVEMVKHGLSAEVWQAAYSKGQQMNLDEVIALAT